MSTGRMPKATYEAKRERILTHSAQQRDMTGLAAETDRARQSEAALAAALARWGIVEWAETDADEQDTGRMLRRCRECGKRVFVAPTEVKHTKDCSIGLALAGAQERP